MRAPAPHLTVTYVFESPSGINNVEPRPSVKTKGFYTLTGVRIVKISQPGIYVINGKKVIVK